MDVTMDAAGGLLGVQFVLQDERVHRGGTLAVSAGPESGRPVFDVEAWPADRYLDVETTVTALRTPEGLLVLRIGDVGAIDRVLAVGEGLAVGLHEGALAEIRIGPLTGEDWEAIDAFSFVPGQA